ncbi:Restriction endonuclease [Pseudomonas cichorii]|uniref:Restriction endonuclease n=1 Tax=Pseudomonas cichorii TaxID=36746 RepID=A0A3M4M167_PSECI|nr:restriction endonuclease [Pseudomonas cichorii]RMQ47034.1 Restriction endonuclease [Pseudomonas cichorii]
MSRKPSSTLEALVHVAAKLPWWLSISLAIGIGAYLNSVASAPMPLLADARQLDTLLIHSAFKGFATFGQYILPITLLVGALVSFLARRKRRRLLESAALPGANTLTGISWHEFELLVGETLRHQGFSVQETGGNGPDGGVDLVIYKDGEKYLVQCKQWRAIQVGVPVVRELYGAMAAEGAVGGLVITSGRFSKPARQFASGRNLRLVDGELLNQWIARTRSVAPPLVEPVAPVEHKATAPVIEVPEPVQPAPPAEPVIQPVAPNCPHCKKSMIMKVARTGRNAGGNFWGCMDYPKCKGIRGIFPSM